MAPKGWDTIPSRITHNVLTFALCFGFTALRFYITHKQKKQQNRQTKPWEYFSLFCIGFSTLLVTIQIGLGLYDNWLALQAGGSTPEHEMSPKVQVLNFTQHYMHTMSIWFLKGSYFAMFFDIRKRLSRGLRIGIYITAIFSVMGAIASGLIHGLWCQPEHISRNWNIILGDDQIISCNILFNKPPMVTFGVLNATSDLMIMLVGFSIIRTLQINSRIEKAAIGFIFTIGFLSMVACIARMCIMIYVIDANVAAKFHTVDSTLFRLQEMSARIEVTLGTAAYGLTFPRTWLKPMITKLSKAFNSAGSYFTGSRSTRIGTQSSTLKSANGIGTQISVSQVTHDYNSEKGSESMVCTCKAGRNV